MPTSAHLLVVTLRLRHMPSLFDWTPLRVSHADVGFSLFREEPLVRTLATSPSLFDHPFIGYFTPTSVHILCFRVVPSFAVFIASTLNLGGLDCYLRRFFHAEIGSYTSLPGVLISYRGANVGSDAVSFYIRLSRSADVGLLAYDGGHWSTSSRISCRCRLSSYAPVH